MNSRILNSVITLLSVMSLGLGTACIPDFPAESPYDPETPEAQQAKAQVMGKIVAETAIELTEIQLVIEGQGVAANADAMGQFKLELAAGEYVLSIKAPQHDDLNLGTLVLNTGEKRDLGRLSLVAKRGAIEGSVKLGGSTDNSGALVSVSKIQRSVFTDASGNFAISDVAIGDYELLIMREGYATQIVKDIKVEEGQSATVSVTLAQLASDADFSINDNALYTAQREVTLNLAGFAFSSVQVSETANFAEMAAPLPRMDAQSYSLSEGDGPKRIFVRFTNSSAAPYEFSKVYSASIILDTTAPSLSPIAAAEYTRALVVPVSLIASDAGSGLAQMQVNGGAWEAFRARIDVTVSTGDGPKSISVKVRDNLGNESSARSTTVTLDTQAPVVSGDIFTINGADTHTNLANVQLQFDVSGADFVQISETQAFTETTTVAYRSSGSFPWYLSGADGSKTLYVRFLDQARNVTMPYSASINLDTVAPNASRMVLGGGVVATNAANVSLGLTPDPSIAGHHLQLQGDITAPGSFLSNAIPAQVTLTAGEGPKVVTAVLYDDAGNTSVPFSAFIELDTTSPDTGNVILADGRSAVNAREVSVTINDTNPDTMSFWERSGASCVNPACGTPQFQAFSPSTSFTLSENRGTKTVCWKFCDEAGNGTTPGSASLDLGTYLPRPRPVLDSISPASYVALSEPSGVYTLTVNGRGIASDTQVHVGSFSFACDTQGNGADCESDAGGGCGTLGACANACAHSCTITLDENVMRNSGNYVVRLDTPDPVFSGQNESADVEFFTVIAPVPSIVSIEPRGVIQETDNFGLPIGQTVTATVIGENLMNNTSIRLGQNYGRILQTTDLSCTNCAAPLRQLLVELDTDGLAASDLDDGQVIVANPAPGGGATDAFGFGLSPRTVVCPPNRSGTCSSNLRRTRVLAGTRELSDMSAISSLNPYFIEQEWEVPGQMLYGDIFWSGGGTSAQLRNNNKSLYQIPAKASGGRIPFVFGGQTPETPHHLRIQDSAQSGQAVSFGVGSGFIGSGSFSYNPPVVPFSPSAIDISSGCFEGEVGAMAKGDLNGDGFSEVLFGHWEANEILLLSTVGVFGYNPEKISVPTALSGPLYSEYSRALELADLNGDGNLDLLLGGHSLVTLLGNGDLSFQPPVVSSESAVDIEVADLNGDGFTDVVTRQLSGAGGSTYQYSAALSVRFGQANGRLSEPVIYLDNPDSYVTAIALGDMDGDTITDIVVGVTPGFTQTGTVPDTQIQIWTGNGLGDFAQTKIVSVNQKWGLQALELADYNEDGSLDIVASGFDWWNAPALLNTSIKLILSNGSGGYDPATNLEHGLPVSAIDVPRALISDDFSGDGHIDLVTSQNDTIKIFLGTGSGTFLSPQSVTIAGGCIDSMVSIEESSTANAVSGPIDILVGNRANGRIELVENEFVSSGGRRIVGDSNFASAPSVQEAYFRPKPAIVTVDIDHDGIVDRVTGRNGGYVLRYGAETDWGQSVSLIFDTQNDIENLVMQDFNGDGNIDLAVNFNSISTNDISIYMGAGTRPLMGSQTFVYSHSVSSSGAIDYLRSIDLDSDGDFDLVGIETLNNNNRKLYFWSNQNAGNFTNITASELVLDDVGSRDPRSEGVVIADVDNDGDLDIVTETKTMLQSSSGVFTSMIGGVHGDSTILGLYPSSPIAAGDMDGDGNIDLLTIDGCSYGNGDGTFTDTHNYPYLSSVMYDGFVHDVDGDGNLDFVASTRFQERDVFIFFGSGQRNPSWESWARYPVGGDILSLAGSDVNKDGAIDILTQTQDQLVATWLLPKPRNWQQSLRDLPLARNIISAPGSEFYKIHSTKQFVEKLSVRIRLKGADLRNTTLSLQAPNGGASIPLDVSGMAANATDWTVTYSSSLDSFKGWQATGDWTLIVENTASTPVELVDYTITTNSWFQRPAKGMSRQAPQVLALASNASGVHLFGTTTGRADNADLSCATTHINTDTNGPGEHWYEFTLGTTGPLALSASTKFKAAIELRQGPCTSATTVLGCDENATGGSSLQLNNGSLSAGTYCLVVDGVYENGTDLRSSGDFEISAKFAECGNGDREQGETCDDGNSTAGDGCNSSCRVESGYQCTGTPSICTASNVTTYSVVSSSQALVPSTSGANVWGLGPIPDDGSIAIAMGFDFMFLADTVQNVTIGSNGLLGFNTGDDYDEYENSLTGSTDGTNGLIAWWWDDLSPATSATSGIRTELSGTAPNRIRTITFENIQKYASTRTVTAEVRFYEGTNVIEVHYGTVSGAGNSFTATAGWENSDGTAGANFIPGCTNDCDENDWLTNTLITLTPQ